MDNIDTVKIFSKSYLQIPNLVLCLTLISLIIDVNKAQTAAVQFNQMFLDGALPSYRAPWFRSTQRSVGVDNQYTMTLDCGPLRMNIKTGYDRYIYSVDGYGRTASLKESSVNSIGVSYHRGDTDQSIVRRMSYVHQNTETSIESWNEMKEEFEEIEMHHYLNGYNKDYFFEYDRFDDSQIVVDRKELFSNFQCRYSILGLRFQSIGSSELLIAIDMVDQGQSILRNGITQALVLSRATTYIAGQALDRKRQNKPIFLYF